MSKLVCIGWNKTGSSSLAEMLRILGYRVTEQPWNGRGKDIAPLHPDFIPGRVEPLMQAYGAFADFRGPTCSP
jgi:hypothetical protein